MNRIERLLWEETQLETIGRLERKAHLAKGVKLISVALLAGVIALIASRMTIPRLDETVVQALRPASFVYTPATAPKAARHAESSAAAPARDAAAGGPGQVRP